MNYPIIGGPFCGSPSPSWCPDDDGLARVRCHTELGNRRIFVYRLCQLADRRPAWLFVCSTPDYSESRHA